jgi:hypothetical protein
MKTDMESEREERFVRILSRDFSHDQVCSRIVGDKSLARGIAKIMHRYVAPSFTAMLYEDRKKRIGSLRVELVKAINGLEAAGNLYRHREPETAAFFDQKATELQSQLQAADVLLDVRRHGRFRDHGILDSARSVLERRLGPMTYSTLANLVNAALQADGQSVDGPSVDEETIRKDLRNFLARNPTWDLAGNSSR